jgi:hypothetical protein
MLGVWMDPVTAHVMMTLRCDGIEQPSLGVMVAG